MDTLAASVPPDGRSRPRGRILGGSIAVVAILITYVVTASSRASDVEAAATEPPAPAGPAITSPLPPPAPTVGVPLLGISVPDLAAFDRFVSVTGTQPEVYDHFEAWGNDRPLDPVLAEAVAARGARLSITWEPWDNTGSHIRQPGYSLRSIAAGEHDEYIDRYARSLQEYGRPVTLRLMHEMNGNWYPWGDGVNGNRPGQFVLAWRHIYDRFAALDVRNVRWLWAPNAIYRGSAPLADLYPGDPYVDLVGMSSYNWGDQRRGDFATEWRTFDSLFDPTIAALQALTAKPIWIAETGSSNSGGSKAQWLADTFAALQHRPEIAGVVWFDHVDEARRVDWRIETEAEAVAAWRTAFESRRSTTTTREAEE